MAAVLEKGGGQPVAAGPGGAIGAGDGDVRFDDLWVPITSSTSCDQVIFVDHATDVSLFSDAVQVEVDRLG